MLAVVAFRYPIERAPRNVQAYVRDRQRRAGSSSTSIDIDGLGRFPPFDVLHEIDRPDRRMIIRSNAIIIRMCTAIFDTNEDCIVVSSLSSFVVVIAGISTGLSTTSPVASHGSTENAQNRSWRYGTYRPLPKNIVVRLRE